MQPLIALFFKFKMILRYELYLKPFTTGPPTCHSLEFQGSLVEGERVSFVASYSGGYRYILKLSILNLSL